MDPRHTLKRKIRWRAERRADIARVKQPVATSLDLPTWLRTFRTAYAEAKRVGSSDGFLVSIEPLLAGARREINAALEGSALCVCPTSEEVRFALINSFELDLRNRLYDALSKTLVLELAVA